MPPLFSESPLQPRCHVLAVGLPTGLTAATPLQDILELARSIFSSLQHTAAEDIVVLGGGTDCPWYGNVELSERAWETFCSQFAYVTVTFKRGMYPLASEDSTEVIDYIPSEREQLEREQHEKVDPKLESS